MSSDVLPFQRNALSDTEDEKKSNERSQRRYSADDGILWSYSELARVAKVTASSGIVIDTLALSDGTRSRSSTDDSIRVALYLGGEGDVVARGKPDDARQVAIPITVQSPHRKFYGQMPPYSLDSICAARRRRRREKKTIYSIDKEFVEISTDIDAQEEPPSSDYQDEIITPHQYMYPVNVDFSRPRTDSSSPLRTTVEDFSADSDTDAYLRSPLRSTLDDLCISQDEIHHSTVSEELTPVQEFSVEESNQLLIDSEYTTALPPRSEELDPIQEKGLSDLSSIIDDDDSEYNDYIEKDEMTSIKNEMPDKTSEKLFDQVLQSGTIPQSSLSNDSSVINTMLESTRRESDVKLEHEVLLSPTVTQDHFSSDTEKKSQGKNTFDGTEAALQTKDKKTPFSTEFCCDDLISKTRVLPNGVFADIPISQTLEELAAQDESWISYSSLPASTNITSTPKPSKQYTSAQEDEKEIASSQISPTTRRAMVMKSECGEERRNTAIFSKLSTIKKRRYSEPSRATHDRNWTPPGVAGARIRQRNTISSKHSPRKVIENKQESQIGPRPLIPPKKNEILIDEYSAYAMTVSRREATQIQKRAPPRSITNIIELRTWNVVATSSKKDDELGCDKGPRWRLLRCDNLEALEIAGSSHLSTVALKSNSTSNHCILVALSIGNDDADFDTDNESIPFHQYNIDPVAMIRQATSLREKTQLVYLALFNLSIDDGSPDAPQRLSLALESLSSLRTLDLSFNFLRRAPKHLPLSLRELALNNNRIRNTIYLEHLTNLQCLDLSHNYIRSITALHPLVLARSSLEEIRIHGNDLCHLVPNWRAALRDLLPRAALL